MISGFGSAGGSAVVRGGGDKPGLPCNDLFVGVVYIGMTVEEIYVEYRDELVRCAPVLVGLSDAEDRGKCRF
jgi:hypothetical protein